MISGLYNHGLVAEMASAEACKDSEAILEKNMVYSVQSDAQ
jgi:hypothetical protein